MKIMSYNAIVLTAVATFMGIAVTFGTSNGANEEKIKNNAKNTEQNRKDIRHLRDDVRDIKKDVGYIKKYIEEQRKKKNGRSTGD